MLDKPKKPSGPKTRPTAYSPSLTLDDFQKMSEIFKSWIKEEKL